MEIVKLNEVCWHMAIIQYAESSLDLMVNYIRGAAVHLFDSRTTSRGSTVDILCVSLGK